MKVFLLSVGRTTRRGDFQEFYSRAISVSSDETTNYQVKEYFKPRYAGFEVIVQDIETIDVSEKIEHKKNSYLVDFNIKLTKDEETLYKEWEEYQKKTDSKYCNLINRLKERYMKLPYFDSARSGSFELDVNTYGVLCKKLPIKSKELINAVKDCVDDKPKNETDTALPEKDENFSDIPF